MKQTSHCQLYLTFLTFCIAILFPLLLSCSSGDGVGTLVITTSPVPAEVIVDSIPRGLGAAVVTLKAGKHELGFGPSSEQFISPEDRTINITAGDTLRIVAEMTNTFIPDPPGGFALADTIRYYGTNIWKMKDGTIYDYIDDGAYVYLKYGLQTTTHACYRNSEGSELVLDIFEMIPEDQSLNAFNDEEICPEGHETMDIGDGGKAYHSEPEFMLHFHKSQYLVSISTTDDRLKNGIVGFAKQVAERIP